MHQIQLTIRSRYPETPPFPTTGEVPYLDCPLAVAHGATFDEAERAWRHNAVWNIVHRPTGLALGKAGCTTKKEALAVLERCDPSFAAWPLATADIKSAANMACAYKFRVAS